LKESRGSSRSSLRQKVQQLCRRLLHAIGEEFEQLLVQFGPFTVGVSSGCNEQPTSASEAKRKKRRELTIAVSRKPTFAPPRFGPDHTARGILANWRREQILGKFLELAGFFFVGVVHNLVHFRLQVLKRLDRVLGCAEFPEVLTTDVESTSPDNVGQRRSAKSKATRFSTDHTRKFDY
jgi:hypothetical protein